MWISKHRAVAVRWCNVHASCDRMATSWAQLLLSKRLHRQYLIMSDLTLEHCFQVWLSCYCIARAPAVRQIKSSTHGIVSVEKLSASPIHAATPSMVPMQWNIIQLTYSWNNRAIQNKTCYVLLSCDTKRQGILVSRRFFRNCGDFHIFFNLHFRSPVHIFGRGASQK